MSFVECWSGVTAQRLHFRAGGCHSDGGEVPGEASGESAMMGLL